MSTTTDDADVTTSTPSTTPTQTANAPTVERPGALPYLAVADGRAAIDWYTEHLGARLRGEPIIMDDGRVGHAELEIGDGVVYLAHEFPELGLVAPRPGEVSVSLMVPVADTDAATDRARAGGAIVTREPYEGYGSRTGVIVDPFGHRWMLTGPSAAVAEAPTIRQGDTGYMSLWVPDADRAARFYGAVLGWEYDATTHQVTNLGHRLGIAATDEQAGLYTVFAVDDLDAAVAAVTAAGGTVDTALDGRNGVVNVRDDQGYLFGLYRPAPDEPRPAQHPAGPGEMSYLTLYVGDSGRFRDFFGAVLGWTFSPGHIDDGWGVEDTHPQVGAAGGNDTTAAVPMWTVTDIDAAVAAVAAGGGEVISGPDRAPYGVMAECRDDQGVRFYLGQLF